MAGKRIQIASWCLFDFANSSFTTVIVTAIFAVYFSDVIAADSNLGAGPTLWNLCLLVSNLVIILTAPVVGALCDGAGKRKPALLISFLVCIVATASLFWAGPGTVVLAMLLFSTANIAFATGENLIASFLPLLVPSERIGWLSSMGWAIGYAGGLAALGLCMLVMNHTDLGVPGTNLAVALFFLIGGIPTFLFITETKPRENEQATTPPLEAARKRLMDTWRLRHRHATLFRFLLAHVVFTIGIYGVIGFGGIYGRELFGMSQRTIIAVFMCSQVTAASGSLLSGFLCTRLGSRSACKISLIVWIIAGSGAGLATTEGHYWFIALIAGFAMGLSLPSARAIVGELSPPEKSAEFFGFWGLTGRLAAICAPLGNLVFSGLAGGLRGGLWFFTSTFVVGLALLVRAFREVPSARQ